MLPVYASSALGAYGYREKPWYQPGERLQAFLDALSRAELAVAFHEAPPATTEELTLFHTRDFVEETTHRCAAGVGSLDRAPAVVNERTRRLIRAIAEVEREWVDAASVHSVLTALNATMQVFAPFLQSEGLVDYNPTTDSVRLSDAGRAFLADEQATLGGPTYARPHIEPAARAVCGAVLDATQRIAAGELARAFIPIAGFHHAHADEARMYCLYNDAALAIAHALTLVDGPIAYIDVDIHHGDGVYEAFAAEPRVILADIHASSGGADQSITATSHTGRGAGSGTACTLAIGPNTTDAGYLQAFERIEAFVRSTHPAFVIFEAGVDGLQTDPMSNQRLTPALYGELTRRVRRMADECAEGRLVVLGGGGYALDGMAAAWVEVVRALSAS